jgi:hypothetical protein
MDAIAYDQSKVAIDRCARCLGVWLDHDEFEQIVKYLELTLAAKSAREYATLTFHEFCRIFIGHEGIESEVKDFLAVLKLLEQRVAIEHPGLVRAYQRIYALAPFR